MKFLVGITCILLSSASFALSCDTYEAGKKTMCNDYDDSGDVTKLKKLCSMGDYGSMKGKFSQGPCSESNMVAKCVVPSRKVKTFYYNASDLSAEEMEKGCKFFKDAVFTNISAKSNPASAQKMNNMMKNINQNPKMKKFMECAKSAKSTEAITKCKSLLM